ncbi:T9SS type A sorting domain-containing protein [candidate division WOR-3 bacterium]|nr:T9SS type A sorting domain-containing protein [candidate division WOR-3 bacterium]
MKNTFLVLISALFVTGGFNLVSGWGVDVPIGQHDSVYDVKLDIHRQSGHLFAGTAHFANNSYFGGVYFSSDNGSNWSYKLGFGNTQKINSVGGTVLDDKYYFCLTINSSRQVWLCRFRTSDGAQIGFNNGDSWIVIFTLPAGDTIKELALISDQDFENYWLNLLVITSSGQLRYFYSDTAGVNWHEITTGVTNAKRGLDACTNEGFSDYYALVSYITNRDSLQIDGIDYNGTRYPLRTYWVGPNARFTSIGAYHDTLLAVYEFSGAAASYYCRYRASYNGGQTWTEGCFPIDTTVVSCIPDVASRADGGQGVVFAWGDGSARRPQFTWRNYHGSWTTPVTWGEYRPRSDVRMAVEYLGNGAYGAIYSSYSPDYGIAYFDRSDWTGVAENQNPELIDHGLRLETNPARQQVKICYVVNQPGPVGISLYDATGRLCRSLLNTYQTPGNYTLTIDNTDLTPAVYIVRLKTGDEVNSERLVFVK